MKIGIITHYYKSNNYGGNLQAYALCEYLKNIGYDVEQISYKRTFCYNMKSLVWKVIEIVKNYNNFFLFLKIRKRKKAILGFNQHKIKHSVVWKESTICKSNEVYDVFITGSDQVWHPSAVCSVYLLDFVAEDKIKFSYAASLAVNDIPDEIRGIYRQSLSDYNSISVREKNAVEILGKVTDKKIECVLDPTLLLSSNEWDKICEKCELPQKYIFCYFLGDDVSHRNIVTEYASKRCLKIATLPHIHGFYRNCDVKFADYNLYDISPAQFISLIKNSEAVFTDSFHASVFSIIYKKDFFVFERNTKESMGARLYTLTEMFGVEERFCDTKDKLNIEYIEKTIDQGINFDFKKYEELKEKSEIFLRTNLEREKNEV